MGAIPMTYSRIQDNELPQSEHLNENCSSNS